MQERAIYISLARIIAAYAVIVIHTNTCVTEFSINSCWLSANFIDCTAGFAVPIFLMISGATLMDYNTRYSTKEFFKKRLTKIVIPFLFWYIVSIIVGVESSIWMVFIFFSFLFGTYLAIPLFSFLDEKNKQKVILYVVIVSFILNYFIPFIESFGNGSFFVPTFEIAGGYLIYALVGYLIHKNDITPKWRVISYVLAMIGWGIHVWGTYFASINANSQVLTYKGYTNLPCLLQSIGVFVFIKELGKKIKDDKICRFLDWLSGYTFPVFFLHVYVINFIIQIFEFNTHSLGYRLGVPILNFIICMIITWCIRKIPILRKILP